MSPLACHLKKKNVVVIDVVFPQTDVMHQSVYELVHTEDQQELRRNLHWALNPPPAAASAITQDSPEGNHSLLLHRFTIRTTARLRDHVWTEHRFIN